MGAKYAADGLHKSSVRQIMTPRRGRLLLDFWCARSRGAIAAVVCSALVGGGVPARLAGEARLLAASGTGDPRLPVSFTNQAPVLANPGDQVNGDSAGYAQGVLADVPAAYWRLGETSGTSVADSAGASAGTLAGNVTLGQAGALADGTTAMRFDGADATRVTIPASAALTAINGANAITMEAWVNPQTLTLPEHFRIFYSFPGNAASYLGLYDGSGSAKVILALVINGAQRTVTVGPSLAVGAWTHVVATYDGTTLTLYENGSAVGQVTGLSGPVAIGTQGVRLGGYAIAGHQYNFDGRVDEAAIYNYALSATQVAAHYARRTVAGTPVALPLVASDPDGDFLTYSATGLPPGLTVDPATGLISGTLAATAAGVYPVTATVSDGVLDVSQTFTWTVRGLTRAPVLTNPGDRTNAEGATIALQMMASDPDSDPLTYSATGLPPGSRSIRRRA